MRQRISRAHVCAFVSGLFSVVGNAGYIELTASEDQASILAPMSSTYLLVPVAFGLIFRSERVTFQKGLGIILAIGSLVLLGLSPQVNFSITSPRSIAWFIVVVLSWGTSSILYIYAGEGKPFIIPMIIVDVGIMFFSLASVAVFFRSGATVSVNWAELVILLAGVFLGSGTNAYIACVNLYQDMTTISPLSALYTVIPTAMGILLLHESVTVFKIVGAVLSFIAGVLLSTEKPDDLLNICRPSAYTRLPDTDMEEPGATRGQQSEA